MIQKKKTQEEEEEKTNDGEKKESEITRINPLRTLQFSSHVIEWLVLFILFSFFFMNESNNKIVSMSCSQRILRPRSFLDLQNEGERQSRVELSFIHAFAGLSNEKDEIFKSNRQNCLLAIFQVIKDICLPLPSAEVQPRASSATPESARVAPQPQPAAMPSTVQNTRMKIGSVIKKNQGQSSSWRPKTQSEV